MSAQERIDAEIETAYGGIRKLRERIAALRKERPPEPVKDYAFPTGDGTARLSDLFAGKSDLMVIHNMGSTCPMCTLWADGFNGILPHLMNRCAFVVSSPEAPAQQAKFAKSRGWRFRMVSTQGTGFAKDMGFEDPKGAPWPGVSVFRRDAAGNVTRVGCAEFGPHDDFCPMFHLNSLFPGGGEWWPKFTY